MSEFVQGVTTICDGAVENQPGLPTPGPHCGGGTVAFTLLKGLEGSAPNSLWEATDVRPYAWPGGKEGVKRHLTGRGVTEGLKEGGDIQMCILGKVFWLQVDSRPNGSEATAREPRVSVSFLPRLWGSSL